MELQLVTTYIISVLILINLFYFNSNRLHIVLLGLLVLLKLYFGGIIAAIYLITNILIIFLFLFAMERDQVSTFIFGGIMLLIGLFLHAVDIAYVSEFFVNLAFVTIIVGISKLLVYEKIYD